MALSNFYMPQFLLSKANLVCLSTMEGCYKVTLIVIKRFKNLEWKVLKNIKCYYSINTLIVR